MKDTTSDPTHVDFWKQALKDYAEELEWVLKEPNPNIEELMHITTRMKIEVKKYGNQVKAT